MNVIINIIKMIPRGRRTKGFVIPHNDLGQLGINDIHGLHLGDDLAIQDLFIHIVWQILKRKEKKKKKRKLLRSIFELFNSLLLLPARHRGRHQNSHGNNPRERSSKPARWRAQISEAQSFPVGVRIGRKRKEKKEKERKKRLKIPKFNPQIIIKKEKKRIKRSYNYPGEHELRGRGSLGGEILLLLGAELEEIEL